MREEKIGSKVSQKTSLPPYPRCRFSSSVSSSFFLCHRKPAPSPFLPPAPPWATNTTKLFQDHQPATTASIISHHERLSLSFFLFSPLCLQPPKTPQTPFSSTNRQRCSLPANPNPHQWKNSHCDRRSLSPCRFSSPSFILLCHQPPAPPLQPVAAHRHPRPNHRPPSCLPSLPFPFPFPFFFFFTISIHWVNSGREL